MAAVLAGGPEAVLSHRSALDLWEVAAFPRHLEVTLPDLGGRHRPGLRIHRTRFLDARDVTHVRNISVTTLTRTLADVAGSMSPRHLRNAYLEAGRRDLLDPEDLLRVTDMYSGKRGIRKLRRLLGEDVGTLVRTRSPLEVRFFDFCRANGIPLPKSNHRVAGYEVDAYWPEARLAVELDSWEFHRGRGAFERDRAKIGDLKLAGIDVIPVTDRRLTHEPQRLAEVILSALAERKSHREADSGSI